MYIPDGVMPMSIGVCWLVPVPTGRSKLFTSAPTAFTSTSLVAAPSGATQETTAVLATGYDPPDVANLVGMHGARTPAETAIPLFTVGADR